MIREVNDRAPLVQPLTELWERAVRATHHFLTEDEIVCIRGYVPQAIGGVAHLLTAEDNGTLLGFAGVDGDRLEMLFVDAAARGRGVGAALLREAVEQYGVRETTVNEQNPQAVGFYEHMGFRTYKRTERDEEGGPYPLLYMRRED